MQREQYLHPTSLQELTSALERTGGKIAAGCTDILPRMRRGDDIKFLIDISGLEELRLIHEKDGLVSIGSLVTHASVSASPLLRELAPALSAAAASVGCAQTRNRGTVGGAIWPMRLPPRTLRRPFWR